MTRAAHRSGTERCAEVAAGALGRDADVLVNVQGDEPLIEPSVIDAAIEALNEDPQAPVSTLAVPISLPNEIMDPNVVKAVLDFEGRALYFSRAPIPWVRDRDGLIHARHWKHLGLYAYRREALLEFATLPQGDLERVRAARAVALARKWLSDSRSGSGS